MMDESETVSLLGVKSVESEGSILHFPSCNWATVLPDNPENGLYQIEMCIFYSVTHPPLPHCTCQLTLC